MVVLLAGAVLSIACLASGCATPPVTGVAADERTKEARMVSREKPAFRMLYSSDTTHILSCSYILL